MSRANQPYEQHHAVDAKSPTISVSQMLAAGLASAGAAAATSRFGVAGTLIGAALTTMIITGGSAVLRSYLETIGGRIQSVPQKLRANRMREQAGRGAEQPADDAPTQAVEKGEGRRGFFQKIRSSFEWFRGLPSSAKRSILLKAAVPMVLVFVIAIVAVTGAELAGGRTLSCMVWGECYAAADGTGGPSTSFGVVASGSDNVRQAQPVDESQDPSSQPAVPGAEQPSEDGGGLWPGDSQDGQDEQIVPEQPAPEPEPVVPEQPAPEPEPVVPEQPVEPQPVPEQPVPATPDQ